MSKWVEVCGDGEVGDGQKTCATVDGVPVVVCRVDGELTAFQNTCPHAGLPLGDGDLTGKIIIRPFHGYTYNVENGKNVDFDDDVPLATFPVRCDNGKIEVQLVDPR